MIFNISILLEYLISKYNPGYLLYLGDHLRDFLALFLQDLPALLLLPPGGDDGALVLLLQLALGGVDWVVLQGQNIHIRLISHYSVLISRVQFGSQKNWKDEMEK